MLLAALLLSPPNTESCGPFIPQAQFSTVLQPLHPVQFARGKLGIVKAGYIRRYLVVAYRYLSGAPLSAAEIADWKEAEYENLAGPAYGAPPPPSPFSWDTPDFAAKWLLARNAIPGVAAQKILTVERRVPGSQYQYDSYYNCLDDAFDFAVDLLHARATTWGAGSKNLAEWIRGQDLVFANCSEGVHIPQPVPPGSDLLLAADRRYQIAAAQFYAEQYEDARRGFEAIALDPKSRRRSIAPYLAARTLIREATIGGKPEAMRAAEAKLLAINDDSSRELLGYVEAHLDPENRMVALSAALEKPAHDIPFDTLVTDYTMLWDKLNHGPSKKSDLADWITTLQKPDAAHAIERWRATRATQWLLAALAAVSADDAAAPELLAAARALHPDQPAYATATYYGLELAIARAPNDDTRAWADALLAANPPVDVRNQLLAQRLKLARDWTEFLRYAPRQPVAADVELEDEPLADYRGQPNADWAFDNDGATAMNDLVPLDLWVNAASNPLLERSLQIEIAQAAWTRAAVLGRWPEARKLAARLIELKPILAPSMREFLKETDSAATQFAAVYLILRNPGLDSHVRTGFTREARVNALDMYRDNWWGAAAGPPSDRPSPAPTAFLKPAERAQGEQEAKALLAAGNAPDFLGAATIAWARQHPADPRVPEALHLIVRATRFGITDKQTTTYSREAFQLLHARYPKSSWTQMTPYWY